jgi:hypothetical protein
LCSLHHHTSRATGTDWPGSISHHINDTIARRPVQQSINATLGNEQESAFARLMREHGSSGPLTELPMSTEIRQQAKTQARKEQQKRKAESAARKANRKKRT